MLYYKFIQLSCYIRVFQLLALCIINVMQIGCIPEAIKICSYNANSDYIVIQIKHILIFHIKFLHLKLNCIDEDSFLL